jgi:pimeloyl-ACP methyl ester carboxylesterase
MLHVLRGGIPGPLVLTAQLAALGAVLGLALAAVLDSAPALRAQVETALGVQETDVDTWALVKRFSGAGALTGGALWLTSIITGVTVPTIPGMWALLGAFAAGIIVRVVSDRPVLVASEDDLGAPDNAPAAMFTAGLLGEALLLATVAVIAYRDYLSTLAVGASLVGAGGVMWLYVRGPVLNIVRRRGDRPIGPMPGLGAVLTVSVGAGILGSAAWLAGGGQRAPWWSATSLLGFAALTLWVRRYVAPPPIVVSRQTVGGHETNVLRTKGRGPEHMPPILLIHGIFSNADSWRAFMQWLALRVDSEIIAVAVPGVAPGVGPIRDGAVLPQLRQWVEACVTELFPSGAKPVVGAASLLGHPALTIAQGPAAASTDARGAVESKDADVLIAGAYVIGTMGLELSTLLRRLARAPIRSTIFGASTITSPALLARLFKLVYRPKETGAMGPWVEELLAGLTADPREKARLLRLVHRVAGELLENQIDLAKIRVPVEFAWSRDDSISPASNRDRVARLANPRLRTKLFETGGHSPYKVHPDLVGEAFIEFLTFLRTTPRVAASAVGKPQESGPHRGSRPVLWWWPPSWPYGSHR